MVFKIAGLYLSNREDKCDAIEEMQEEVDAVKQSEQHLRIEAKIFIVE